MRHFLTTLSRQLTAWISTRGPEIDDYNEAMADSWGLLRASRVVTLIDKKIEHLFLEKQRPYQSHYCFSGSSGREAM